MQQIVLNSHPTGLPTLSNFRLSRNQIPELGPGDILIQTLYLSVDPYMRGQLGGRKSSHPPFQLNQSLWGDGVGKVVESRGGRFQRGDLVVGSLHWSEYTLLNENAVEKWEFSDIRSTAALGPLGMCGLAAYFGFLENAMTKVGETVVVSGAAGAVGSMVGQIAKIRGCRVIGITGSQEKVEVLKNELGFDGAVNYKDEKFVDELRKASPKGVDIYYDNVGGMVTDQALSLLNKFGRIVLCGQISTYQMQEPDVGLRHFRTLIIKSATARGFRVWDYQERFPEGRNQIAKWIREGKIRWKETIVEGLENAPKALLGLFSGANIGKQLVKI